MNSFRSPYVAIGTLVVIQSAMTLSSMSPTLLKQFHILINLAVMVNLIPYLLAMASVSDLQKAEDIPPKKARIANIAGVVGGIYSVYAVYGCGWTVILSGFAVTGIGLIIYAMVSSRLRYMPAVQVASATAFQSDGK